MSQENVEIVRQGYEAWNRGDRDAMVALFHPDAEFATSGTFVGLDPVYSGHDALKRFWREFHEPWESLLVSIHELRDCGEEVVALITFEGRGRDGMEVGRKMGTVWAFRDGLAVRLENHGGWTEALEAAGLQE